MFFDDHVAQIDADPKPDALLVGHFPFALGHPALDLHGAAHSVHYTREVGEHTVAGILDSPAMMLLDLQIDQFAEMHFEAFVRALLIGAHHPRIACDISSEDRGETAGRAHSSGRPA